MPVNSYHSGKLISPTHFDSNSAWTGISEASAEKGTMVLTKLPTITATVLLANAHLFHCISEVLLSDGKQPCAEIFIGLMQQVLGVSKVHLP
jgi:hypothetical protein